MYCRSLADPVAVPSGRNSHMGERKANQHVMDDPLASRLGWYP